MELHEPANGAVEQRCPVCNLIKTEYYYLECKHMVCETCLDNLVSGKSKRGTIGFLICPVCSQVTDLKPAAGFENNSFSNLTEVQKLKEKVQMIDEFVQVSEDGHASGDDSDDSISISFEGSGSDEPELNPKPKGRRAKLLSSLASTIGTASDSSTKKPKSPKSNGHAEQPISDEYRVQVRLLYAEGVSFLHGSVFAQLDIGHAYCWNGQIYNSKTVLVEREKPTEWDEMIVINLRSPQKDRLRVRLRSQPIVGRVPKIIGEGSYPCAQLPEGQEVQVFVPLYKKRREKGGVFLGLTAFGFGLPVEAFIRSPKPKRRQMSSANRISEDNDVPGNHAQINGDTDGYTPIRNEKRTPKPNTWLNGSINGITKDYDTPKGYEAPKDYSEDTSLVFSSDIEQQPLFIGNLQSEQQNYVHAFWGPVYAVILPSLLLSVVTPEYFRGCKRFLCSFTFYLLAILWIPTLILAPLVGFIVDLIQILAWILSCGLSSGRWSFDVTVEANCDFGAFKVFLAVLFFPVVVPWLLYHCLCGKRTRTI